jgi:hypothetical protein
MSLTNDVVAVWALALVCPAVVFVTALSLRQLQPLESEPARTAEDNPQLRDYAWRAVSAIPAHWPAVFIGGATLLSAGVLTMITAHLMRE